jgi:putative membrane protein
MSEQMHVLLASFGPLSAGMGGHILLMNLLAPAVAVLAAGATLPVALRVNHAVVATGLQLLLLWGWHAPPSLAAAMERPTLHLVMQLSLTIAAVWFWIGIVNAAARSPWRAVAALLITSKLFCLLGVLLTFASRPLYPAANHHGMALNALADQQLAGLMMLIACPLSYLVAAVIIAARWLVSSDLPSQQGKGVKVA